MASIYLDASNQINNHGVGSYGNEGVRMNQLADKLHYYLILGNGNLTVYRNNINMSLSQTVNHANSVHPDIYFALHTNAGGGKGTEIYYYPTSSDGKKFATIMYDKISKITISSDRGIKTNTSFYVIRNTTAPAILIETMFHDNLTDVNDYLGKVDLIAKEMAKGIYDYFGMTYNDKSYTLTKKGDKGVNVTIIQNKLNKYFDSLKISGDGDFGNLTEVAVKRFQTLNNLTVDGIVGEQTMSRLKSF